MNLSGDDMGVLIGKRGQTLDSIQYLCSLVVNKGEDEYILRKGGHGELSGEKKRDFGDPGQKYLLQGKENPNGLCLWSL